ncbi:hypothetical protein DV872_25905 [Oceanispirochaeta sp. M1]|nr:hypothetical protein DV872_25905 [Oceanispirochaeta sp. M1]
MTIIKNILRTFKIGIFFTALIHIVILVIISILKSDIKYLNYYNILDIDLFIPNIIDGYLSQIFSFVTIVIILSAIYIRISIKSNKLIKSPSPANVE